MSYAVPKRTLTYADTLHAVGLASLLEELTGSDVRLLEQGDSFVLEGKEPPDIDTCPDIGPGYPFIYQKADDKAPPGWVVDYDREKEKNAQLREFRKATGKKRGKLLQSLMEQGMDEPPSPVPEYQLALFLASMRKGWSADKQLYRWLQEDRRRTAAWVFASLNDGNRFAGDSPEVTNSQVFNPISGKGVHRPKPDSTTPASISGATIDPFAEWMKFRGAYRAMLPYRSGDDFKVFVIEPADIRLSALTALHKDLRALNLWGGVRLDFETLLRLTEFLIRRSDVMGKEIPLAGRNPRRVIRGLHQAYFQSLGTAAALMNYSFTALPSWFTIKDREDANDYLNLINSFVGIKELDGITGCLRSLNEDHSSDIPVLQHFRKWLMTGDKKDFLEFCHKFALHVMERMGRDEWVKTISTGTLNILFGKGYNMQKIINAKGFQSMAKAIRNATIYALTAQKQKQRIREVHFGLAQKWKQKIKGGDSEFVAALGDFVQQYNWESENIDLNNVKTAGHTAWKQHKVLTSELDEVIGLINEQGAELVGMLLLAYGYARVPKTVTGSDNEQDEQDEENEGGE